LGRDHGRPRARERPGRGGGGGEAARHAGERGGAGGRGLRFGHAPSPPPRPRCPRRASAAPGWSRASFRTSACTAAALDLVLRPEEWWLRFLSSQGGAVTLRNLTEGQGGRTMQRA